MINVLVIEDDRTTAAALQFILNSANIECDVVNCGREGLEIASTLRNPRYDLVILDLLLPDMHGYELLQKLRVAKIRIPVLILSALSESAQKVQGLDMGADDYMTKPYSKEELVARVYALVRRSKGHAESVLRFDKLCVNLDTRRVDVDGKLVHLTSREYAILELLVMRKGTVLTKETFLDNLYRGEECPDPKIIDVFVCKLREKLYKASGGKSYIETVWGSGYMLKDYSAGTQQESAANSNAQLEESCA